MEKVRFYMVNVDHEFELADQHNIEAVPTLVLLKSGQEIDRQEGALSKPALTTWIKEHLDGTG